MSEIKTLPIELCYQPEKRRYIARMKEGEETVTWAWGHRPTEAVHNLDMLMGWRSKAALEATKKSKSVWTDWRTSAWIAFCNLHTCRPEDCGFDLDLLRPAFENGETPYQAIVNDMEDGVR